MDLSNIPMLPIKTYNLIEPKHNFFDHFNSILFRKFTLFKRSFKYILITSIGSIFFCGLAILIQYLMKVLIHEDTIPITFNSLKRFTKDLIIVTSNPNQTDIKKNINILTELFINDTKKLPNIKYYLNRTDLNNDMYNIALHKGEPKFVAMGIGFEGYNFFKEKIQK